MSSARPARAMPAGVALAGAVLIGLLTAVQARMNGSLGLSVDDGFVAAFVSFGSGFVILAVLAAILPMGRRGTARLFAALREGRVPVWMLLGGIAGALTTASQGLTVATIGVALFTVGLVAGQTVNGLVLDRLGYGPGGAVAVTLGRVGGAGLAVAAVIICLAGRAVAGDGWWMLVLPFLAGAGIAWQQATNGRLRQRIDSPFAATLVNFAVGAFVLAVAAGVHIAFVGIPDPFPVDGWMYLGGAAGVLYIFLSTVIVRVTGVLLLGLGSVVGQLATAIALDALWPPASGFSILRAVIAVVVALAGVIVAVVPFRRRSRG